MPTRSKSVCKYPHCPQYAVDTGAYCAEHRGETRAPDNRPSSFLRGYDSAWKKAREWALSRAGIPREAWPLYDVDHRPAYDREKEPDHFKYELIPMLKAEHSRKTVKFDGGFGNEPSPF